MPSALDTPRLRCLEILAFPLSLIYEMTTGLLRVVLAVTCVPVDSSFN